MRVSVSTRGAVLLVIAIGLVAAERSSFAGSHGEAPKVQRARQHFLAGKHAFETKNYPRALAEFEAGYALEPRPGFLLNMGHAVRKMGEVRKAIELYQQFLATGPADAERSAAEALIAQLEKGIEPATEPAAPASEPAPASVPAEPSAESAPVPEASPFAAETAAPAAATGVETAPSPTRASPVTAGPTLQLSLNPVAPVITTPAPLAAGQPGDPFYRRWWFWTGVGGLVVGVAAVVLIGMAGAGGSAHDSGSWGQIKL